MHRTCRHANEIELAATHEVYSSLITTVAVLTLLGRADRTVAVKALDKAGQLLGSYVTPP